MKIDYLLYFFAGSGALLFIYLMCHEIRNCRNLHKLKNQADAKKRNQAKYQENDTVR